jgi:hypothetical protein
MDLCSDDRVGRVTDMLQPFADFVAGFFGGSENNETIACAPGSTWVLVDEPVTANVLIADGREYQLGVIQPTATILSVKALLAAQPGIRIDRLAVYLIDDARHEEQSPELKSHETLSMVQQYQVQAETCTELRFAAVLGGNSCVADFIQSLSPSPKPHLIIDFSHFVSSMQSDFPLGVACVPAHPNLVVVTCV